MRKSEVLRVGTDCSGIEAPIQALKQLQIPYKHIWSSDIDKYVIQSIKANYNPDILYGDSEGLFPDGDITKRDHSLLPDIDLYVAGFPCQPWSSCGKEKGFNDKRGNVFWGCIDVIKTKRPKYFILENVKGILWNDKQNPRDKFGRTWKIILETLQSLSKYGYKIKWNLLNTKDYGIPQNRHRVFIVGSLDTDFEWPEPTEMDSLIDYIDYKDQHTRELPNYVKKRGKKLPKEGIVNLGFLQNSHSQASTICPCILALSAHKLWNMSLSRYCNVKELLKLQGFEKFNQVVSDHQQKKQIGNSMSVNVLCAILNELL